MRKLVVMVQLVVLLGGCKSRFCERGDVVECDCALGEKGQRRCFEDERRYGTCACPQPSSTGLVLEVDLRDLSNKVPSSSASVRFGPPAPGAAGQ